MTASVATMLGRKYPRLTRVNPDISGLPGGCVFLVASDCERYRVEKLGGEEEFTRMMLDEVSPGDVFYDIGACVGVVSVHAAKRGARVIAFEPDPSFRDRIIRNLQLNELNNVTVMDFAVSDSAGGATLFTDGVTGLSPSLRPVLQQNRQCIQVPTDAIDDVLSRDELPWPDVIKLDVEGAEVHALRGMRNLLSSSRSPRAIFIELHPNFLPGFGATLQDAEQLIECSGYRTAYDCTRADQVHRIYRKAA
jgi:FkbM family methyltransferase